MGRSRVAVFALAAASRPRGGNAAGNSRLVALNLTAYPGYVGAYSGVVGSLALSDSPGAAVAAVASWVLEAGSTAGWHVHEGSSCAIAGDHFYGGANDDPWAQHTYNTDADGRAAIDETWDGALGEFTLGAAGEGSNVLGRTVVVHLSTGVRALCGEIPTTAMAATPAPTFSRAPTSTFSPSPTAFLAPSSLPSTPPTPLPSPTPSPLPSPLPSALPSLLPSPLPTATPTASPAASTAQPTASPARSSLPSLAPTALAVKDAEDDEATRPSPLPTPLPSPVPTALPSAFPTAPPEGGGLFGGVFTMAALAAVCGAAGVVLIVVVAAVCYACRKPAPVPFSGMIALTTKSPFSYAAPPL
mmetsp:Transcript_25314/g.86825  ORF Transcript_25314/g.86825 Transcript_25314/m.86825 type:complete len:358 (-) Transcript_25314:68-1141(-)